jgi:8-oxo-dGTP diphosphatase
MALVRSDRTYPVRPLPGVGAVVWDGRHILLERRGRPPAQDTWALPGGLIELGETAEVALRREVQEECGIDIRVGPILGLFQPIVYDADGRLLYHYVVVDFLAYYVAGDLTSGDDAAEVRWVEPAALPDYNLAAAAQEMIGRALSLLAG